MAGTTQDQIMGLDVMLDVLAKIRNNPSNPYVNYNNQDRIANVALRYYMTWLESNTKNKLKPQANFLLDKFSTYQQGLWTMTALMGIGTVTKFALDVNGAIKRLGDNFSIDELKSQIADLQLIQDLTLSRQIIIGMTESSLLVGNAYRWSYKIKSPAQQANYLKQLNAELRYGEFTLRYSDNYKNKVIKNYTDYETSIKQRRSTLSVGTFTVFSLNALIAVGINAKLLSLALALPARNAAEQEAKDIAVAIASLSLATSSFNALTNASKGVSTLLGLEKLKEQFGVSGRQMEALEQEIEVAIKAGRMETVVIKQAQLKSLQGRLAKFNFAKNGLNYAGTVLGLLNGLTGIATLAPLLFSSNLTEEQKAVVGAEMAVQVVAGFGQVAILAGLSSAARNAAAAGRGLSAGAKVAGGIGVMAVALMAVLSPMEIYGLIQQSKYVDQLKDLQKEFDSSNSGWAGDGMLADLYHDKTKAEGGLLAANLVLTAVGTAVMIAEVCSVVAAPAALITGLVLGAISSILEGVRQPILESIATDYANKITEQGGSFKFFSRNLLAKYNQFIGLPQTEGTLLDLQDVFNVDQVIGVTSITISRTALELAAITRNADKLKTANMFINEFVNGKPLGQSINTISLDPKEGVINTSNIASGKQLITFLSPLMAPGEEFRKRVEVGKNEYFTSLEIIFSGKGWTFTDGDASTTFNMRNVVSRIYDVNGKIKKDDKGNTGDISLIVNAGGGDDTLIANTSQITYDGGEGKNTIIYDGIDGSNGIIVYRSDSGFCVKKSFSNVKIYSEVIHAQSYTYGKRTETVEYRDVELKTIAKIDTIDTLKNVQNITGTTSNDSFLGNDDNNYFDGVDGSDSLWGGGGNDTLDGGSGKDFIYGDAGDDFIIQKADAFADVIDGGEGFDTVQYNVSSTVFLEEFNSNNGYQSEYSDWSGGDYFNGSKWLTQKTPDKWGFITREGKASNTDQFLMVTGASDVSKAFWKKTVTLIQGATYQFSYWINSGGGTQARIKLFQGGKGIESSTYTTTANKGWQQVTVSFQATATGNVELALRDLEGGGDGNDFAIDQIELSELRTKGINADLSAGRVYKYSNNQAVYDTLRNIENLHGTKLNDTLIGDGQANCLLGDLGNDSLDGGAGNDDLQSNEGNDSLLGGEGNDSLIGGIGNDYVNGGVGDDIIYQTIELAIDTLDGGDGNDTVNYGTPISQLFMDNFDVDTGYQTDYGQKKEGGFGYIWLTGTTPDWGFSNRRGKDGAGDQFLMVDGANDTTKAFWKKTVSLVSGSTFEFSYWINSGSGSPAKIQLYQGANAVGTNYYQAQNASGWTQVKVTFQAAETGDVQLSLRDLNSSGGGNDFAIDHISLTLIIEKQYGVKADLSVGKAYKYSKNLNYYDTLTNIENLFGSDFNDTLIGNSEANVLSSGMGDDSVNGQDGADHLFGGDGADTLVGGNGDDYLQGGGGADQINGGEGKDDIAQDIDFGNDTIDGGAGLDTVDYSLNKLSSRPILFTENFDSNEGYGSDYREDKVLVDTTISLMKTAPDWGFSTRVGRDGSTDQFLMVDGARDATKAFWKKTVTLVQGVTYEFSYWINSAGGAQAQIKLYQGGTGVDSSIYTATAGSGWKKVTVTFQATTTGDVELALKDLVTQTISNDFAIDHISLVAQQNGINADLSKGKVYKYSNANYLNESLSDTLTNIENLVGTTLNDTLSGNGSDNTLTGEAGDDLLNGMDGNDLLDGDEGRDTLNGGDKDDTIDGGSGEDRINGQAGNDTINQDLEFASNTIDGGDGIDLVNYSQQNLNSIEVIFTEDFNSNKDYGSDYREDKVLVDTTISLMKTAPDWGFSTRVGRDGSTDQFLMVDGARDATKAFWKKTVTLVQGVTYEFSYWINSAGGAQAQIKLYQGGIGVESSIYTATAGSGWKKVTVTFQATTTGDVELALKDLETQTISNDFAIDHISLVAQQNGINADLSKGKVYKYTNNNNLYDSLSNIENLMGTNLNDTLIGNATDNQLFGFFGNDSLDGDAGDDLLSGGIGNDTLKGGAGDDDLAGGSGSDVVSGGAGNDNISQNDFTTNDTLDGGDGNDTADYSEFGSALITEDFESTANFKSALQEKKLGGAGSIWLSKLAPDNWGFSTINGRDGQEDQFLMVDNSSGPSSWGSSTDFFWKNTVELIKDVNYEFSFWINVSGNSNTKIRSSYRYINSEGFETNTFQSYYKVNGGNGWQQVKFYIQSPVTGKLTLSLLEEHTSSIGSKFAIDHIEVKERIVKGINADLSKGIVYKYSSDISFYDTLTNIENLTGTSLNDTLIGNAQDNKLFGDWGDDIINGGHGNDMLCGGKGGDSINGDSGDDLIIQDIELISDTLDGGVGIDTVDYSNGISPWLIMENFSDNAAYYETDYNNWKPGDNYSNNGDVWIAKESPDWGFKTRTGKDGSADQFLMVNGSTNSGSAFWKQTVKLLQGVTYELSYWINSGGGTQARIKLFQGGKGIESSTYTTTANKGWQQVTVSFQATATGNVELALKDLETAATWNDFAIDHIELSAQMQGINIDLITGRVRKNVDNTIVYDTLTNIENAVGTSADDTLSGNALDNVLTGFSGNDIINGLDGKDTLNGADGNDTLDGGNDDDLLMGGSGIDQINGGAGNDKIVQDIGSANDSINGGDGYDTLDYSSNTTLTSGVNVDLSTGYAYKFANSSANFDSLSSIENVIGTYLGDTLTGSAGDNQIAGGAGADSINGGSGDDLLMGEDGNDTINGGDGNDILSGGNGRDLINGGAGDDVIIQNVEWVDPREVLDGGEGNDTIDYSGAFTAGQSRGEWIGFRGINADLGWGRVRKFQGIFGNDSVYDEIYNIENIVGTSLNDTLYGSGQDNVLTGGVGDDYISGEDGNDILQGGDGNDRLDGGNGDDYLMGGSGIDQINGGAGNDKIVQDIGSANDSINGGDGYDTLDYSSNTTLTSGVNVDLSNGYAYKFGNSSANFDSLSSIENVIGTYLGDTLTGSAGDNQIAGGAGADSINGMAGKDTLMGGDGNDTINGGDGNDVIDGGYGRDSINGGAGDDMIIQNIEWTDPHETLDGGDGNDTVDYSGANFTAGQARDSNVGLRGIVADLGQGRIKKYWPYYDGIPDEVLNIENVVGTCLNDTLTGNGQDNVLTGGVGDDSINGGDGKDTLNGGDGNDTLDGGNGDDYLMGGSGTDQINGGAGNDKIVQDIGSANDSINGGDGYDTLDYSSNTTLTSGVNVDLSNGYVYKFANSSANFDSLSSIENVIGTYLSDTLTGSAGDNQITGGAGADSINGMAGNDTLMGGDGNDTINGGDGNDVIDGGYGRDSINGGAGDDVIIQNIEWTDPHETLDGGDGNDTVDYSGANFTAGQARDSNIRLRGIVADLGRGRIKKYWPYYDGIPDEVLNIENVVGTCLNDTLTGNGQDNVLTGGVGDDYISGEGGHDILQGGDGNDTLTDTSGNAIFWAGSGNDGITGGSGNELCIGGAGNDSMTTGSGNDIIAFNKGDGIDTVNADNVQDNILSIGGGATYADLQFAKSGVDLELQINSSADKVILKDWYSTSAAKKSVLTLQMVVEASSDYSASSTDSKYNKKVASFDFRTLVRSFDSALTATPGLSNWSLSNALTTAYLNGSDNQVLGGDLAYQYGRFGSLSNVGYAGAQSVLTSGSFGSQQALQSSSAVGAGIRLS